MTENGVHTIIQFRVQGVVFKNISAVEFVNLSSSPILQCKVLVMIDQFISQSVSLSFGQLLCLFVYPVDE